MSFTQNALARWQELQALAATPGLKLASASPWVPALFRTAFTRSRPQLPLEEFHRSTDSFLAELRRAGVELRVDWSARQYADDWVARRYLSRLREDGRFVYEPTETTVRFLEYLDGLTGTSSSLNSSRLATLLTRVEALAHETDPDPEARITVLQAEIAQRQEKIRALEAGEAPASLPDATAVEAARDVLALAAGLPADFKRMRDGLELMLHTLRAEIVESNATKGITMGEVLEADKRLRGTSEGRTYESFTAFLNDEEQQQRFRQAIAEVLERDFADALDAEDRRALQRLMPQLRAQSAEIHRIYGRLSESMHTFVQSDDVRESIQLRQAIRAAEAAILKSRRSLPGRRAVIPAPGLFGSGFESVSMVRLYDPQDHQAPAKLPAPPAFTEADIHRVLRTPQADAAVLSDAVRIAVEARGPAPLSAVYAQLEPQHRHLNSLRWLLQHALNSGGTLDADASDTVTLIQIDGSERTAVLPAVTFTKAADS